MEFNNNMPIIVQDTWDLRSLEVWEYSPCKDSSVEIKSPKGLLGDLQTIEAIYFNKIWHSFGMHSTLEIHY